MRGAAAAKRLPYPGLRSFERDETDLFFGRQNSVNDMIRRLAASRFLAVLGASGSGKSSLVRTGLLDGLELGLLAQAGSWWRIVEIRPGADPLRRLARGLCGRDASEPDVEQMRARLLRGPRSIVSWCLEGNLAPGENLLILVDQFEELFRYQHYEGQQEAQAFVGLLIESARNRDAPIYTTLTMRSEFLGACALFGGLAEAMNDGQYLTPRMNRQQCREAIEGPAAVCGFDIEPALVNRLLNDLSDFAPWDDRLDQTMLSQLDRMVRRADQLPLLQHALNRLWVKAAASGGSIVLKLADYEALGGLRGALDQHAGEIAATLGKGRAAVVEQVFRALTVGSSIADAVRRPTRLGELVEITGASFDDVVAVCNAFRAPGCNFLTPFEPTPLGNDTIIDISHESLIRQWTDLSNWVETEARDLEALRRLNGAAVAAETEAGDLLHGRELSHLAGWRDEARISDGWARRHIADPGTAFAFLERSKQAERRSRRGQSLVRAAFGGLATVLVLVAAVIWIQYRNQMKLEALNADLAKAQAVAEVERAAAEAQRVRAEAAAAQALEQRRLAEQAAMVADEQRAIAELKNAELLQAQAELTKAQAGLTANLSDTVDTIREYVGSFVDKLQRSGQLTQSGDLLAALAETTGETDSFPQQLVDRFAWQTAANSAGLLPADEMSRRGTAMKRIPAEPGVEPNPRFALWRDRDGTQTISVVDRDDGRSVDVFAFDESSLGILNKDGHYFLSSDGKHALLVGDDGRLYRWSSGDTSARRVFDRRWIGELDGQATSDGGAQANSSRRILKAAAFDPATGSIAVVYAQFNTDFLTLIPRRHAWLARSWPIHRITELIKKSTGVSLVKGDDDRLFHLLAAVEGKPVLEASWAGDGTYGRGLVSIELDAGAASWIVGRVRDLTASRTTDLNVLHVAASVPFEACRQGSRTIEQVVAGSEETLAFGDSGGFICYADLQLSTGKLRDIVHIAPPSGDWTLDPAPFSAEAGGVRMTATRLPTWIISTSAVPDPSASVAVLRRWLRYPHEFYFPGPTESFGVVDVKDGFRLSGQLMYGEPDLVVVDSAQLYAPGAGHGQRASAQIHKIDEAWENVSVDGSGSVAVAFDGLTWSASLLRKSDQQLILQSKISQDCLARLRGEDSSDGLQTRGIYIGNIPRLGLKAIHRERSVFAASLADRSAALVEVTVDAGTPDRSSVSAWCLAGVKADSVVAVDVDQGLAAFFDSSTGQLVAIDADELSNTGLPSRTITLPATESLRHAAFLDRNRLVVLTQSDRLVVYDLADPGAQPEELPSFLPGAEAIRVHGDDVLFLRDESAPPGSESTTRWMSAVVVDLGAADPMPSFVGFLPPSLGNAAVIRLADDRGTVEILTPVGLGSFSLPPAPAAEQLALTVAATGQPARITDAGEAALVELGAKAVGQLSDLTANPYRACISALERALHALDTGDEGAEYNLVEAKAACADRSGGSVADAAIELLSIGRTDTASLEYDWPPAASKLLGLAASGDATALYALLVWAESKGSTTLAGGEARRLLNDNYRISGFAGGAKLPPPEFLRTALAGANGADPYVHRTIAYAAENAAGERNPAAAFRHYWLAEKLFRDADDTEQASEMALRRVGLALDLPLAARVAEAATVVAWSPVAPSGAPPATLPTGFAERLGGDLREIDKLGARLGQNVDLLKLHLSSLLAEALPASALSVRADMVRLLLSRQDWPSMDLSNGNELLTLFDTLAASLPGADGETRLKLNLAVIDLLEHATSPIDLTRTGQSDVATIYLRALEDAASGSGDEIVRAAEGFSFGKRAFTFNSVRLDDLAAAVNAERIFAARIKLAALLRDSPDAQIASDVTKFWHAALLDHRSSSGDPASQQKARDQGDQLLREAFSGLADRQLQKPMDAFDDLRILGYAGHWALGRAFPPETFDQNAGRAAAALAALETLDDAVEEGTWNPDIWADPVTSLIWLLQDLTEVGSIDDGQEPPFHELVPASQRRKMSSLHYFVKWQRLLPRGSSSIIYETWMDDVYSGYPAYAIAYVAGREHHRTGLNYQTGCDRLAASLIDPNRRAPGVNFNAIDFAAAEQACDTAIAKNPDDATTQFQTARALSETGRPDRQDEKIRLFMESAASGYAAAFNNLDVDLPDAASTTLSRALVTGYSQRVILDHFSEAWAGFHTLPEKDRDDDALRWMVERAAQLGSPEASLRLSDLEIDPADRWFRRLIAVEQLRAHNRSSEADDIEAEATYMPPDKADQLLAKSRADAWNDETLVMLTPELRQQIIDAMPTP